MKQMAMLTRLVFAALALSCTATVSAQTGSEGGVEARSLQLYSAGLCVVLPDSASEATRSVLGGLPGVAVGMRNYNFIAPALEGGFYWYLFGSSLIHQAGSVSIADSQPFGAGWRKTVIGPVGFDVGAALVTGARIEGNTVSASGFIGVSFTVGVYYDAFDAVDFGIMAEPVLMLWPRGLDVAARDYLDVSLCVALKSHYRSTGLPWRSTLPKER